MANAARAFAVILLFIVGFVLIALDALQVGTDIPMDVLTVLVFAGALYLMGVKFT